MSELQSLKARAQFYPKGHIVPHRVFAVTPRKYQHLLTFGCDSWVLPGKSGYVVIQDGHKLPGSCGMRLKKGIKGYAQLKGSIRFVPGANTIIIGDLGEDQARAALKALQS